MSWIDTGYPAIDGKEHLKIHLNPQIAGWGIKEVITYPKAMLEKINPPIIQIDFKDEEEPEVLGVGPSTPDLMHTVHFQVWYFSEILSARTRFDDILTLLSKIRKFLYQNPIPDNYGHLYTGGGATLGLRGFNIVAGPIETSIAVYGGGYIDIFLQKILSY